MMCHEHLTHIVYDVKFEVVVTGLQQLARHLQFTGGCLYI